jgi:hypothetical protein
MQKACDYVISVVKSAHRDHPVTLIRRFPAINGAASDTTVTAGHQGGLSESEGAVALIVARRFSFRSTAP